ncbi:Major facilitator superfamily domain containing protein [Hyaloscypha variabilis]
MPRQETILPLKLAFPQQTQPDELNRLPQNGICLIEVDTKNLHPEDIAIENKTSLTDTVDSGEISRWNLVGIGIGALIACFAVGLDSAIIATALPVISSDFKSLKDIGWYGSAFYLPQAILQPFFGKFYTIWRIKVLYLSAIVIFEVGSLIAMLAPTSLALIIGRATCGVGAAGIVVGVFNIFSSCFPPKSQNLMYAAVTAIVAGSNVLGPILGGALTDSLNWRWCFTINLPIGGVAFLIMLMHLKLPTTNNTGPRTLMSWQERIAFLDLCGTVILSTTLVCLLYALEMLREVEIPVIRLCLFLGASGMAALSLIIQQSLRSAEGLLPKRILLRRNCWAATGLMSCCFFSIANHIYFLPIFLQTIFSMTPQASGFHTLPYLVTMSVTAVSSVLMMKLIPIINPFLICGSAMLCLASGLITTLSMNSPAAHLIGYEILAGGGVGLCLCSIIICPKSVLTQEDLPRAQSIIQMFQILSQAFSTQIAAIIFNRTLASALITSGLPQQIIIILITDLGALRSSGTFSNIPQVLSAYQVSFQTSFKASVFSAVLAFLFSLCIEWNTKV